MSETISDEVKQQLVIAGAIVAGKGATAGEVADEVKRIAGFLNPNSDVQRAFAQLDKEAANTVSSAGFIATVIGYAKEEKSNRGVVMFRSSVTQHTPEAKEHLRTDFLDDGGPVSTMMNSVKALVGHKVQVSFDRVKKSDGSGHTVRVLKSIVDRGIDPEFDASKPEFHPVYYTDADKKRLAEKLDFFPRPTANVAA